ncbi:MAG: SixA phosphatase family protein, partial [Acidimicrobiales bacterium]
LYGASPDEVLEELSMVGDDVASTMVVGHNPTFEALVAAMARQSGPALTGGLATCALAVFELPISRWAEIAPRSGAVLGVFTPPFART